MWSSTSGKAIIIIVSAIIGLFILRFMAKRNFKIIQPTWLGTQTNLTPQTQQVGLPTMPYMQNTDNSFRGGI